MATETAPAPARVELSPVQTLRNLLEKAKSQIAIALPKHMTPERMIRVATTAFLKTPDLQECSAGSIVACVVQASELGLELTGPLGQAYMVPYYNKHSKCKEAQFQVGYRGLIDLAYRSGKVITFSARVVYANDRFKVRLGTEPRIDHEPTMGEPGDVVAVYAVIVTKDGGKDFEVMSKIQIDAHRSKYSKQNPNGAFSPWNTAWEEMAKKGLAIDTPIPTPGGWSTMEKLEKGDLVFDGNGDPTRVLAVSEVKNIECYRVTFSNGDSIVCDHEHLWPASIGKNGARFRNRHGWNVYPVTELYSHKSSGEIISVPVVDSLHIDAKAPAIDPWLLGFWLGDGDSDGARMTCHEDDLQEVSERIASTKYALGTTRRDHRSRAVKVGIRKGFLSDLRSFSLLGNKHVPAEYLRGREIDRRDLLRGLMDSDGCMERTRGRAIFANTNKLLSDAVAELATSLGDVVHRRSANCRGFGTTAMAHMVSWQPNAASPVSLSRKQERFRPRKLCSYRSISAIERVPSVPTKCIAVESDTRTYLAGQSMVVTHNTPIRRLAKRVPLSVELVTAAVLDEYAEAGILGTEGAQAVLPDLGRSSTMASLEKLNGANGAAKDANKSANEQIIRLIKDVAAHEGGDELERLLKPFAKPLEELTQAEAQDVLDALRGGAEPK